MEYRRAELNDIPQLSALRKKQLQDEGQKPDVDMDEQLLEYFQRKMTDGDLVEWVAEKEDGTIIATAAIVFMEFPPAFTNPTGRKGYVANMYTAEEYRGQGIAGALMRKLEQEAKNRGIKKLVLHASALGRKAYVKSGFHETDVVMEKDLI